MPVVFERLQLKLSAAHHFLRLWCGYTAVYESEP